MRPSAAELLSVMSMYNYDIPEYLLRTVVSVTGSGIRPTSVLDIIESESDASSNAPDD